MGARGALKEINAFPAAKKSIAFQEAGISQACSA